MQTNPYVPPVAPVDDIAIANDPQRKRIPRTFLVLLAIYFLLDVLGVLFTGQFVWLGRTAILGIATWRTLQGSRPASFLLGGLFALNAVLAVARGARLWPASPEDAIGELVGAAFVAAIAAYIFLSPALRATYVEGDVARWRGR